MQWLPYMSFRITWGLSGLDSGKKCGAAPETQGKGRDELGEKTAERNQRDDTPEVKMEREQPSLKAAAVPRSGRGSRA